MRYFAFRCRSRQFRKIFLFWIFSSLWAHFQILLNTCRVKTASDNSIDIHVLCHFCCALLSSNVSRWFHGMSEEEIWLIHLLCPIQLWSVIVVVVAFGYSQQFQFQNACECAILIRLLTFLTLCYLLSVFFQLKENGLSFYCSWWIPMTMWLKANFWSYFVFMFDIMFLLLLSLPGTVHTQSQSGRVGKKPNDYSFFSLTRSSSSIRSESFDIRQHVVWSFPKNGLLSFENRVVFLEKKKLPFIFTWFKHIVHLV